MSYTLNLTPDQVKIISKKYEDYSIPHTNNYTLFRAKYKSCTLTIYKTKTLLLQGSDDVLVYNEVCKLLDLKVTKSIEKEILESIEFSSVGSDEVGTGDFFGPIVVASCKVESNDISFLTGLGVKDSKDLSDEKILEIAPILMDKLQYSIHILDNLKFNYLTFKCKLNMNRIKAIMHNSVLRKLVSKIDKYDEVIIDAFCSSKKYFEYLKDEPKVLSTVKLIEKAENKYLCVACASIIARYTFLKEFDKLSNEVGFEVPKGAGPRVDAAIEKLHHLKGLKYFYNVAKCNFKNLDNYRL